MNIHYLSKIASQRREVFAFRISLLVTLTAIIAGYLVTLNFHIMLTIFSTGMVGILFSAFFVFSYLIWGWHYKLAQYAIPKTGRSMPILPEVYNYKVILATFITALILLSPLLQHIKLL